MIRRHDDAPVPLVAGQQHQVRKEILRTGGDGKVDAVERGHLGDLFRRALVQMQPHFRVLGAELLDDRREHVARLGVRRADGERAAVLVLQVVRDALDVLHLAQDLHRPVDDLLAGGRDFRQRAAAADKDAEAELILEQLQLLADSRLRGMQLFGGRRDIQAALGDGSEVPELLEFHIGWSGNLWLQ